MLKKPSLIGLFYLICAVASAQVINLEIRMSAPSYVIGEDVTAVVSIKNLSPIPIIIDDYELYKEHRIFFEIFKRQSIFLPQLRKGKVIEDLSLEQNEGEAFDVTLSEWYRLIDEGHYMIRAVLLCNGRRYESKLTSFDIVAGVELSSTSQIIRDDPPIERKISLVYWTRNGTQLAFVRASDKASGRIMKTICLGTIILVKKPAIVPHEINRFFIYTQASRDILMRSEILSDKNGVTLRQQQQKFDNQSSSLVDSIQNAVKPKKK